MKRRWVWLGWAFVLTSACSGDSSDKNTGGDGKASAGAGVSLPAAAGSLAAGGAQGASDGGGNSSVLLQPSGAGRSASPSAGTGSIDDACGGVVERAAPLLVPTDVIWAVDTSGSMAASFPAIQQALTSFSQKVVAAGVDAHVVLLAGAGDDEDGGQGLCVPQPVGSGMCGAATSPGGPAADSKAPTFLHLDLPFGWTQGMPTLLDHHEHYKHLLRPGARTQLVLTEDGSPLLTAEAITEHVEGRASATLGAPWSPGLAAGSYQWNGVICKDGIGTSTCLLAFGAPEATLSLISSTGGKLGNLDDASRAGTSDPFAALLDELATVVIAGAKVRCDYGVPPPPAGQTFDRDRVNVLYRSGAGELTFPRAPLGVECGDKAAWKFDDDVAPTRVELCPAACAQVQGDPLAEVAVKFGCETVVVLW